MRLLRIQKPLIFMDCRVILLIAMTFGADCRVILLIAMTFGMDCRVVLLLAMTIFSP